MCVRLAWSSKFVLAHKQHEIQTLSTDQAPCSLDFQCRPDFLSKAGLSMEVSTFFKACVSAWINAAASWGGLISHSIRDNIRRKFYGFLVPYV